MLKNKYDRGPKAQAVKWVAKKFNVEADYVRKAINNTSTGGITDDLRKAYATKYQELKEVLS